jgi:putative acyl-CoA dehydrogenase
MSDAFLILAQAPGGLSCFLLPRWTPDGERNRFYIQRLKDKLGNKSNASSEVEFDNAYAVIVGEEGRGARTIIEMVNHTRLDCSISSSALMRQALVQAIHHSSFRSAFGKRLVEHPLMKNVLADLALESEAATMLTFRLAGAYDRANESDSESAFRRIATAVSKYWLCKRAPMAVAEAVECLGGNGYVEESIMPRLYREAPLNSIWEGSGNVICLDVLRAIRKEPQALDALMAEIEKAKGADTRFDSFCRELQASFKQTADIEAVARIMVEKLALALQASLLLRSAPKVVADAFCASRLTNDWGHAFGTLPAGIDFDALIDRAVAH